MVTKERADQIAGGVFLVGLGLLFTDVIDFWPGILFVIGAANIARGMAQGRAWYNVSGGLGIIAIGLIFLFNFSWPLLLILIGIFMLFGHNVKTHWNQDEEEKSKNDWKYKNDESGESARLF
jgi:hypothetical protein